MASINLWTLKTHIIVLNALGGGVASGILNISLLLGRFARQLLVTVFAYWALDVWFGLCCRTENVQHSPSRKCEFLPSSSH